MQKFGESTLRRFITLARSWYPTQTVRRRRGNVFGDEVTQARLDGLEVRLTTHGDAIYGITHEADRVRNAHFEISQANETFRFLTGLAAAVFSFLTAAAVVLFGAGIELNSRELILGSVMCMSTCAGVWVVIVRQLLTLALVAMRAERRIQGDDFGIVQFFALRHSRKIALTLQRLSDYGQEDALAHLRRWRTGLAFGAGTLSLILLVTIALLAFSFTQPWAWIEIPRLEKSVKIN